jgi:hypothetical protein
LAISAQSIGKEKHMDPEKFVLDTVMSVATHFAQKGVALTVDKSRELIEKVFQRDPSLRGSVDIDELAEKAQAASGGVGRIAYNEETLARFLEIPVADLSGVSQEGLDIGQLYSHIRLESRFSDWLDEWGYEIERGCPLAGLRGVEYVPDVYGTLNTLHGNFEACFSLVCDNPPDEDRVFALLGKIEAYAEAKKSFSYGDIFCVVTPHRFTQGAVNAMGLQNEQENYAVLPLDGGDIHVLENARSPKDRLEELQDKVRQAEEEMRRSRIRKAARGGDFEFGEE